MEISDGRAANSIILPHRSKADGRNRCTYTAGQPADRILAPLRGPAGRANARVILGYNP